MVGGVATGQAPNMRLAKQALPGQMVGQPDPTTLELMFPELSIGKATISHVVF